MLKDFLESESRPKVSFVELQILGARTADGAISLNQMSEDHLKSVACLFVFRAAAISGLNLPDNTFFVEEIEAQVLKFLLKFGYKNLNEKELELALQLNLPVYYQLPSGVDIQFIEATGSFVNVNFLGNVLKNYMTIRNVIDRRLKNYIDGIGYNY